MYVDALPSPGVVEAAGDTDLSPVEQLLVEHVGSGRQLDLLGPTRSITDVDGCARSEDRTIRAEVVRRVLLGRLAPEPDPRGVAVRGARILGRLDLEHLATTVPLALRECVLEQGIVARDAQLAALTLTRSRLHHPTEPALDGGRLTVRAGLRLDGVRASAHADAGAVVLEGAEIGGSLTCSGAVLRNDAGPALNADGVRLRRSAEMDGGFEAAGAGALGAVRLVAARIGDSVILSAAVLRNASGPALLADSVQVERSILLNDGFDASSTGPSPTLQLCGARIGETVHAQGAVLRNRSGAAFSAEDIDVGADVLLKRGFVAEGSGGGGAVLLLSARIGGLLDCQGARLYNGSASALDAENIQVGKDLFLRNGFEAVGGGPRCATIDLASAHVGGVFAFDPARFEHLDDPQWRLGADGFSYRGVPQIGAGHDWLRLLRTATPWYAAQPYQQLACAHREAGHDNRARRVLMEQRRDQLHRSPGGTAEQAWGRITGLTRGYGYQPWRALVLLLVAVSAAIALTVGFGGPSGALARTTAFPAAAAGAGPCSPIQLVGVGLDIGLPLVTTGTRNDCQPTETRAGRALTLASWLLKATAWAFTTLFIAGFTSAVRKT
jgi:hypothetical protein